MSIAVRMLDGPVPAEHAAWPGADETGAVGAVLCFEGIVRAIEEGRAIVALDYEAYEPMASQELHRLAEEVCASFGLRGVEVVHSRGRVPVGQCSFRLRIAAEHRAEALRAMAAFIDRLKQDVPIWKTPVYHAADAPARATVHRPAKTKRAESE